MRKVKIAVATVATTLLVASPAFAANNGGGVFTAETGFMQDTTLRGAGFDLTAGSISNNGFGNVFENGDDNGVVDDGGFFDNGFEDGFFD